MASSQGTVMQPGNSAQLLHRLNMQQTNDHADEGFAVDMRLQICKSIVNRCLRLKSC